MAAARNRRVPRGTSEGRAASRRGSKVTRSRAGNLWVVAVVSAAVLLLILVFVLQNGQRVEVSYLGARGTLPMGVALLLAAALGVLLVAIPGTIRILQLRMAGRRRPPRGGDGPPAAPTSSSPSAPQEPAEPTQP